MAKINIQTSQNVRIDYDLASVGDRILATLIDGAVMVGYVITLIILLVILAPLTGVDPKDMSAPMIVFFVLISLPYFLYNLLCEIFFNGQTIGKKQMKIKVIKMDGTQPTIGAYLLRWLLRPIDIGLYGVIAILAIVIGGKGQRLGDMAAGTTVIKMKQLQAQTSQDLLSKMPEHYTPQFPEVTNLNDTDINLIKEAINVYRISGNNKPVLLAADRTKELLGISNNQPPLIFLDQVVKDYSYMTAIA